MPLTGGPDHVDRIVEHHTGCETDQHTQTKGCVFLYIMMPPTRSTIALIIQTRKIVKKAPSIATPRAIVKPTGWIGQPGNQYFSEIRIDMTTPPRPNQTASSVDRYFGLLIHIFIFSKLIVC